MTTDPLTSRRSFLGRVAALSALTVFGSSNAGAQSRVTTTARGGRPNSVFNGVRIGAITYSYRSMFTSAEETLAALIEGGLSEVELMGGPIEAYAGLRPSRARGKKGQPVAPSPSAATTSYETQLVKCRELRKLYNDAGVNIHLHKIAFGESDEEIDFNFQVAKALGCVGITTERSDAMAKKLGPFADKHKIWVGFHNHLTNFPSMDKPDPILDYGEYIGFNLDVGHYVAGSKGLSPLPMIEKYHKRIVSLHLKDKTADNVNMPWGQGQTPIKEILQLMRKERWTFPADIELEYKIPEGSNAVAEVAKCVHYCREALA